MKHKQTGRRIKDCASDRALYGVVNALLALMMLLVAYPLLNILSSSFSSPRAVSTGRVVLLPVEFSLLGYQTVFAHRLIGIAYRNTIFYSLAGTLINLTMVLTCAYPLSRRDFPLRSPLMIACLITMYFSGGLIPTYIMVKNLGLVNTRWVLVLMGGLSVYNVIVTRVYFTSNIPEALYEAARIDGASELRIFGQLALPLSGPIVAVIALYYAVGHWNDYFTALIYATKKDYQPLSLVLRRLLIQNEAAYLGTMSDPNATEEMLAMALQRTYTAAAMKYSLVFISSAPMLIAYPFVQKFFVKGMMIGSLKG